MPKSFNTVSLIWLLSAVILIVAWYAGKFIEQKNSIDSLNERFSHYSEIKQSTDNSYVAFENKGKDPIAFITIGEGMGYGGELNILVDVDTMANLQNISLINQKETHSFLKKVINKGFLDDYKKLNINQFSSAANFPDVISGATITSEGIHQAILDAVIPIADHHFGITIATKSEKKFKFGLPEIILILLYGIAFFLSYYKTKRAKLIRWLAIFISIIFIGFMARQMLTLSQIGSYILGFWPDFYEYSFWYILLFGLVLGIILKGKNHYCDWVCPFGHTQELLGKIGNAKSPNFNVRNQFRWGQRILALTALSLGLIYRNPSKTSFELFSGLFVFTGSDVLFIALALIIILSLFIKNPWCNYLCPIKPSIDFLRKFREILLKK